MSLIRFFIREAAVLMAFIILGGLLLVSLWFSSNVSEGLLAEFKNDQVSVILDSNDQAAFRKFAENYDGSLRYEIFEASANKEKLRDLYPELSSVLQPLEDDFFPVSATVTVQDGEKFISQMNQEMLTLGASVLHQPPVGLRDFLNLSSVVFIGLWGLALLLLLYFQLERIAFKESQKWSLYKMLGANTSKVFLPLWVEQMARVLFSSGIAIIFSYFLTEQIESLFNWNWVTKPYLIWSLFLLSSIVASSLVLGLLFRMRYREVQLG
jgi:hypothetical protein